MIEFLQLRENLLHLGAGAGVPATAVEAASVGCIEGAARHHLGILAFDRLRNLSQFPNVADAHQLADLDEPRLALRFDDRHRVFVDDQIVMCLPSSAGIVQGLRLSARGVAERSARIFDPETASRILRPGSLTASIIFVA